MKDVSILGCGWLGLELGKVMVNQGYQIKGSVTKKHKVELLKLAGIEPYNFNWSDINIPKSFFDSDVMIITIPPSTPNYKTNLKAFISLIKQHALKKVIYTSASSVYPDNNSEVKEEDAEYITSPHSGLALLELEDLLRNQPDFESTILRFAGLYGPDRIPGKFLSGKKEVPGGNKPVNLIHRADCVAIILSIIEHEIWGETLNACADIHPNRAEFYRKACIHQNLEPPTFSDEIRDFKIVNSDKLKDLLNYTFLHADPMKDIHK